MLQSLSRLITVPVPNPDDARRRRLLNVILVGVSAVTVLATFLGFVSPAAEPSLPFLGIGFLLTNAIIYLINRRVSGILASGVFLLLLVLFISFGDAPQEVVQGRTLFFLSIPILISSILLPPSASFAVAAFSSLISTYLSLVAALPINTIAILGFFTVAYVGWLSSRSLEQAIREVRVINAELDQRVEERTIELASANERLKELDLMKSKFISDVSHELRTPVSNLMIYLDILQSGSRPEQSERFMGVLREETERLTQLVNDVLDISHLELGVYDDVEPERIEINGIVRSLLQPQRLRASVVGVKLIDELSKENLFVRGTREQIIRVIGNLVSNAVKYTAEGHVRVRTWRDGDRIACTVEDTGFGIPEEDLDYVFDRFYRGENVSQSTISGTGLGLSIAGELIEMLGGEIHLESQVDVGTRATVYFPSVD